MQRQRASFEAERSDSAQDGAAASNSTSRALVPVHPSHSGTRPRDITRYPSAPFLAHLIAVDRRMPQTRVRGRAAPADAAAVYGATLTYLPTCAGRSLRRSA